MLHVRYTARDGGATLRTAAAESVLAAAAKTGARLLSASTDFGDGWFRFGSPAAGGAADRTLQIDLKPVHFPFQARAGTIKVTRVDLLLDQPNGADFSAPLPITITAGEGGTPQPSIQMKKNPLLGDAPYATVSYSEGQEQPIGKWSFSVPEAAYAALAVEDLLLIVYYTVSSA